MAGLCIICFDQPTYDGHSLCEICRKQLVEHQAARPGEVALIRWAVQRALFFERERWKKEAQALAERFKRASEEFLLKQKVGE